MTTYKIQVDTENKNLVRIAFGTPADNNVIVVDAMTAAKEVGKDVHGRDLYVNGSASLPVAFTLTEAWQHLVKSLNFFDPKLGGYVRTVAKGQKVGEIFDENGEKKEATPEVAGKLYNLDLQGETLKIGFGEPAQNDRIVQYVVNEMGNTNLGGGTLLKVDGAASLIVGSAIASRVASLYGAVAIKDPKLAKFVVAITHSPTYKLGDLID